MQPSFQGQTLEKYLKKLRKWRNGGLSKAPFAMKEVPGVTALFVLATFNRSIYISYMLQLITDLFLLCRSYLMCQPLGEG